VIGITTSYDPVSGWWQIAEIQFALYDAAQGERIFLARYVAAADATQGKVYVEDPSQAGVFLGPYDIGAATTVETPLISHWICR
jgi:hypothetical protein